MALRAAATCKECGWTCSGCADQTNLHLHVEIENLKQRLLERERHIVNMETNFLAEADKFPNGEFAALTEELLTWQDKYSRLYESYKRVQKVNQNLEDKLLKIVDKCETEKNALTQEVVTLNRRLAESLSKVNHLQSENERYRNDVNLAIQLLQCKPSNFVPQKYDSLPADLQRKVLAYVCGRRRPSEADAVAVPLRVEARTIKVPVSSSPPVAMVYSVNEDADDGGGSGDDCVEEEAALGADSVSAAVMAKVLEERQRERESQRGSDRATQTQLQMDAPGAAPCARCGQASVRYVDAGGASRRRVVDLEVAAPGDAPSWTRLPVTVKPTESGLSRLTYGPGGGGCRNGGGPRLCSVRLRSAPGNILLDSAASRPGSAVLVHAPRCHSSEEDDVAPPPPPTLNGTDAV